MGEITILIAEDEKEIADLIAIHLNKERIQQIILLAMYWIFKVGLNRYRLSCEIYFLECCL